VVRCHLVIASCGIAEAEETEDVVEKLPEIQYQGF